MHSIRWRSLVAPMLAAVLGGLLAGCEQEGPAERAGEQVDQAVGETRETVQEAAERAGEQVDQAVEETRETMQQAVEEAGERVEEAGDAVREQTRQ